MEGTGVSNQGYRQYNDGNLELFRSTVTGFGQGVLATQMTIDIEDSVISGNTEGGGVEANFYGDVDVVDSTISGNVSRDEDGKGVPAAGAGVRAYYSSNVDVINSTIVGNRAIGPGSYGGGAGRAWERHQLDDRRKPGRDWRRRRSLFGQRRLSCREHDHRGQHLD